jgi:UDP-N-acetylglucosamine/UDP-N-acetylgalactosamine 4-epimerase
MTTYQKTQAALRKLPLHWLVTGGAGFIGSHVVEKLLSLGQTVRVFDDLSTGRLSNLEAVKGIVGEDAFSRCEVVNGDIRDTATCERAMAGIDRVIHLAAMGSVPLSMDKPADCHAINVTGTMNIFLAAHRAGVKRLTYASSSAVYGDDALETKREESIGKCLSPYAASKRMNEIYAQTFGTCFGFESVGFRYFNVFGPRQDPKGAYAAVIPQWIAAMKSGQDVFINGDGGNTRDFCFVRDIVQANILGAMTENSEAFGSVFNVGLGKATSLNELFTTLQKLVSEDTGRSVPDVIYRDFRAGDIRHSCADASKICAVLDFLPENGVMEGLRATVASF